MRRIFRACWPSRRGELILLLAGVALAALGGCASLGPKPWEHDLMAEPAMRVDAYPLQSAIDDHIYFSKEASSGGRSFAGGGCGCN
jgi:Domain of unknown function (DUF4266)